MTISTSAASRRDAARQSDGKFGNQNHTESSVNLVQEPPLMLWLPLKGRDYLVLRSREDPKRYVISEDEDTITEFTYGEGNETSSFMEAAISALKEQGAAGPQGRDEDRTVCSFSFSEQDFELVMDSPGHYVIYEGDGEVMDFEYTGDPEDHDCLESAALQELEDHGHIERCRAEGCGNDLDDGQGFDGYCGDCADQAEADGEWDHHDAHDEGEG